MSDVINEHHFVSGPRETFTSADQVSLFRSCGSRGCARISHGNNMAAPIKLNHSLLAISCRKRQIAVTLSWPHHWLLTSDLWTRNWVHWRKVPVMNLASVVMSHEYPRNSYITLNTPQGIHQTNGCRTEYEIHFYPLALRPWPMPALIDNPIS